jgi:hypothetical protein
LLTTQADIVLLVLNSTLEESLARFTGKDAVMEARNLIPAYWAGTGIWLVE